MKLRQTARRSVALQPAGRAAQPQYCGPYYSSALTDEDGKDTLLRPRNFRIAVAYRLGMKNVGCRNSLSFVQADY